MTVVHIVGFGYASMIRENWRLVTDGPVEFEK